MTIHSRFARRLLAAALFSLPALAQAQTTPGVGIGTTTPDASAALDVVSPNKGLLPPRMSQTQRDAIASPAVGLTIFNTFTGKLNTWNGSRWEVALSASPEQTTVGAAVTFGYTGAAQTYLVPAGTTSLTVDAAGAAGSMSNSSGQNGSGGRGARVQATLAVTPGETLTLYVGGAGTTAAGGYNGGGTGSNDGRNYGGGGGGASDIRRAATVPSVALADRLLVAAGGGGGGYYTADGGAGGAPNGSNGATSSIYAVTGTGATQTAGGTAGGTLGQGGNAGPGTFGSTTGGGGGGGYYGGGGGGGYAGGGGGSSWVAPTGSNALVLTAGYQAGNGTITLTPVRTVAQPALDGTNFVNVPGDNLGNHTATQNLNLADKLLVGNGGTSGLAIGSTGNVGIGTSTPVSRLSFGNSLNANAAKGRLAIFEEAGSQNFFGAGLVQNGGGNYGLGLWGGTGGAAPYDGTNTTQLPHLYLDQNTANVGIGTITPGQRLDVAGNANVSGDGYVGGNGYVGGKVGVGTTSPNGQLANTSVNTIGSTIQGGAANALSWATTQGGYVAQFYNGGTSATSHGVVVKVDGTDGGAFALDVSKGAQNTPGTSLLAVKADGNVGIGTGAPSQKLEVAGQVFSSSGGFQFPDRTVQTTAAQPVLAGNGLIKVSGRIVLGAALTGDTDVPLAGNKLTFSGTGNVGIGTTSPGQKLEVDGGIKFTGAGSVLTFPDGSTQAVAAVTPAAVTASNGLTRTGNNIALGGTLAANTDVALNNRNLTFSGTGKIGVGLTNPQGQLANTNVNTLGADNRGGNGQSVNWATVQDGYVGQFYNGGASSAANGVAVKVDGTTATATALDVSKGAQDVAGTSLLAVKASGNVGIGTRFPNSLLDLGPSAGAAATDAATRKLALYNNTGGTDFYGFGVSTGALHMFTNAAAGANPDMTISNSGNVGIGDSNPVSRLTLTPTTAEAKIALYNGSGTSNYYGLGISGFQQNYHVGSTAGSHVFYAGGTNGDGTELLRIKNDGTVGIGISAPAGGLHVTTGNGGVGSGATGAILSGPLTGNPNLELRGGSTAVTPYIDFAETSGVDYSTRLRSISGVLNVEGVNSATTPLFKVNGGMQATNVTYTSDRRFKQNIRPLGGALAAVLALRGVRYEWNALGIRHGGTAGAGQVGVIAQEVELLYPELVSTDPEGFKAVNYAQLTPVLLEALKEQQAQLESLKVQNAALQADVTATTDAFEARLRRLEAAGEGQARR